MGSSRTIQTIIQAIMLVLLGAIVVELPKLKTAASPASGESRKEEPTFPSDQELRARYRAYFSEDDEAVTKAELLSVGVRDVSMEGNIAYVKFRIVIKWIGHNSGYTTGPLKNAPGLRGNTVTYSEVFRFRRWRHGWDIEGRREKPIIQ